MKTKKINKIKNQQVDYLALIGSNQLKRFQNFKKCQILYFFNL